MNNQNAKRFDKFLLSSPFYIENFFGKLNIFDRSNENVEITGYYSQQLAEYFKSKFLFELTINSSYLNHEGDPIQVVPDIHFNNIFIAFYFQDPIKTLYMFDDENFNNANFFWSIDPKKFKFLRSLLIEEIKARDVKTEQDQDLLWNCSAKLENFRGPWSEDIATNLLKIRDQNKSKDIKDLYFHLVIAKDLNWTLNQENVLCLDK